MSRYQEFGLFRSSFSAHPFSCAKKGRPYGRPYGKSIGNLFPKTKQYKTRPECRLNPYPTARLNLPCFVLFCWLAKTTILGNSGHGSRSEATFLRGPKAPRAPWARSEATFLRGPKAPNGPEAGRGFKQEIAIMKIMDCQGIPARAQYVAL